MNASSISRRKPPALRPGDTIGIVAPASSVAREDLDAGCEALRRAGYRPLYSPSIFEKDLYFAGSVDRRLRELEEMFLRDDVRAIVCARGGYGSNYLLSRLDLTKLAAHHKILVAYSDLTALQTRLFDAAGLITFHGPMVAKDWAHDGGVDLFSWQSALSKTAPWEIKLAASPAVVGLVEGEAEGTLYGGCLSILAASLGTPYEIKTDDTILFVEDVAEPPYRIDRMLMQLKLAGKLDHVRGLVFGEMRDCLPAASQKYNLPQVITRIVGDLGVPVAYGVTSGHVTAGNITLPIGVRAKLDVRGGRVSLKILESAVAAS